MRIVKIQYSGLSLGKNRGTELAPDKIVKKSKFRVETVKVSEDVFASEKNIYKVAKKALKGGCIFLGGDHSLTYNTFKAFSEKHKNAALVFFDAHADCMQFFKPYSHEDIINGLINEGKLKPENLLMVGVRKIYKQEKGFVKRKKLKIVGAKEIHQFLDIALLDAWLFTRKLKNIYVSVDIDVFDKKFAPGTGYTVPNGLTEREFFKIFDVLLKSGKVKALDITEVNPKLDKKGKTVKLARKILGKAVSGM